MLEIEQVKKIIEAGVSEKVQQARTYADLLNMHVTGLNVDKHIEEFTNFESKQQKAIRKRLQKSNKSTFSFLLRPLDKIFTAKGGVISYNLSETQIEDLKLFINDVSDGLNIKNFLKKIVKTQYIIDPNGFVMVDVDLEGNLETKIFNSKDYIWSETRGNEVKAIVFNPFKNDDKEDEREFYRVIDNKTDSIYVKDGDSIYLDESSVLENFFGKVPAYILGDIKDPNTDLFISLIDDILEDAKELLRDVSIKTLHKLSHGYTKYWQRPEACTNCGGEGEVKGKDDEGQIIDVICPSCQGKKIKTHKDVSDVTIVPIPNDGEQDIAPNIGGFISPDMAIWNKYDEDVAKIRATMYQTLWGATYSIDAKNDTATGKLLNVQPQAERVTGVSETFSNLHKFILDCNGKVILFKKDYSSEVSYGTRYLMESPDELLQKCIDAKSSNLPIYLQNDLLEKYYQTEHTNNNQEYIKSKKIIATDPFPNMTANELKDLGVADEEVMLKIYHPQWVTQLSDAKKVLMNEEELRQDLKEYVKSKTIIKNKENELQQRTS